MSLYEEQYLDIMKDVLVYGYERDDRTGTGTKSLFGTHLDIDMSDGTLPVITTKKVHYHSVVTELCWMLRGETNIKYLRDHGVTIWDEWADELGDLGPVYGGQWRGTYPTGGGLIQVGVDQIEDLIKGIESDPHSRRHIVNAWNVDELCTMALPPCHMMFQCYVLDTTLNMQVYQRSADIFLGVPFNIASYGTLLKLLCRVTGLLPGKLRFVYGDVHLYNNHVDAAREQLVRNPKDPPRLSIRGGVAKYLKNVRPEMFTLEGYDPHPAIKAEVSV